MTPSNFEKSPVSTPLWVTEPFRVFLPLGILSSIVGVLIWPLFYANVWAGTPPIQHPRFMIFGFGFAFVTGFLGTAWPRFLEAAEIRRVELAVLVGTWSAAQVFCILNWIQACDAAFAIHAFSLFGVLTSRLRWGGKKEDRPPAGLVVACGTVFTGGFVAAVWALFAGKMSLWQFTVGELFLWQGLLLLPLLGVGSFLFGRFFEESNGSADPGQSRRRVRMVWVATCLVLISFGVEAAGLIRLGNGMRLSAVLLWLFLSVPSVWKGRATSTRALVLRVAVGSVVLSLLIQTIWPGPGHAFDHILFLSGFGLVMLVVGDRVTMGHSDRMEQTAGKSRLWRWLLWLILLAAATRASADFKASILISHHIYAAVLWAIIGGLWFYHLAGFWWRRP